MKKIIFFVLSFTSLSISAQNIGIGTTTPQATLDVKGNQRIGGASNYMTFDSLSAKIEWKNAFLYAPVSQALMKHSAAADGLFYNNIGGIGKIEYRNASGNPVFYTSFVSGDGYFSNRLGIGNLTPQFPLSLNGNLGDKISLWTDGTPTHYGMGIQSGLFQIFSKTFFDDIAFGYGNSSSFTEAMRVKGNGNVGIGNNPFFKLDITGRMRIRTGADGEAGIWLNNAANTSIQSFIGLENDTYAGLYGAAGAGWGFGMNTLNGNVKMMGLVGIGTTTPNAPLSFAASLGKKITLYPGVTGDVGMAVQGNLLQIYADNPSADIALGYDQAGVFTERFRVKANGALMINGNAGTAGQVLKSNGPSSPPVWITPVTTFVSSGLSSFTLVNNGDQQTITSVTVTVTQNSYIEVSGILGIYSGGCFGCGDASVYLLLNDPSQSYEAIVCANPHVIGVTTLSFLHRTIFPLSAGNYVFTLKVKKINGPTITDATGYTGTYEIPGGRLTAKVIPF